MNRARHRQSPEIVEAESLWGRADVDREAYRCASCELQVFPASFDPKNRRRPYFTKPPSRAHDPLCEVVPYERLTERASQISVIGNDGELPVSYPDRLRPLGGDVSLEATARAEVANETLSEGVRHAQLGSAARRRRYAAGSLHLICRTFIDFPYDRTQLRLQIDGVEGRTYDAIFKHVESSRIVVQPRPRLFYGPMKFNVAPTFTDEEARLSLACGDNKRTPSERLYEVRVKWSQWSRADRERIEAEVETTRQEARQAWSSKAHAHHAAWVFFLGEQPAATPALFAVRSPRAICCLFAHLRFPLR